MKVVAVFVALVASASAFAPAAQSSRVDTTLNAKFFQEVFNMDLFAPVKDQNDYGARGKKNLKTGKLSSGSYVPNGLTQAQYQKIRDQEDAKKGANYQRNVAKAGKFIDYTDFYLKRGTEVGGSWMKAAGKGHTFAKTKYDFSGGKDEQKTYDGGK